MIGRSDLPPPPPPPGAVPPNETWPDPERRWLPIAVVSLCVLVGLVLWAVVGGDDTSPPRGRTSGRAPSAECTTVDMGPLTGWKDPVTVVELGAAGATGIRMYAWGIDDAVWVSTTDNPEETAVIVPVNQAARDYDPVTGADVDVFQSAFADAASGAERALASCG